MNRRNFFKAVTGFIAGAFIPIKKSESSSDGGGSSSPSISPQKYPTLDEICRQKNYLDRMERLRIEAAEKMATGLFMV